MGVFNQWTHLYLKLRSNCRCNCSSPMLTRVKIQTETHCEWPKVPRYPLHQHACSRSPLGIPWRARFNSEENAANPIWKRVCEAPSRLFDSAFKPDHLTFSGYNLLLSTLRIWYFIYLKRSKREQKRKTASSLCTAHWLRAATCTGKPSSGIASDSLRSVSRVNPEMKHSGSLSANFSFASSWQLIFPSVLFQETCVFFFVCFVDLPQLVLTAVDSVKWTHYKNPL